MARGKILIQYQDVLIGDFSQRGDNEDGGRETMYQAQREKAQRFGGIILGFVRVRAFVCARSRASIQMHLQLRNHILYAIMSVS